MRDSCGSSEKLKIIISTLQSVSDTCSSLIHIHTYVFSPIVDEQLNNAYMYEWKERGRQLALFALLARAVKEEVYIMPLAKRKKRFFIVEKEIEVKDA